MPDISRRNFIKTSAVLGGSAMLMGMTGIPAIAEEEKPLKVRALVCSPTGGTMNAAYMLASMIGEAEVIDQVPLVSRKETITFAKDEVAILAAPAYAGKIPAAPGLFENIKGDGTPCVVVATYGNREAENCNAQMAKLAADRGFVVIGAIKIITPHIFGARAGHSRPDVQDIPEIKAFAEGVKAKIKAGNLTPVVPEGDPAIMGKPTLHSVIDKQLDAAKCVGCGLCINNCPVGAIGNDLAINLEACIECQRCSHICPVAARTYYTNWDGTDGKYLAPRKPVTYML